MGGHREPSARNRRLVTPPVRARRRSDTGEQSAIRKTISTSCWAVPSGRKTATVFQAPELDDGGGFKAS